MKVAIIGSRTIKKFDDLYKYIPENVTEIVSGGALGVDRIAREYAQKNGIKLLEIIPDYNKYGGKVAPLKRNDKIVEYADYVIAIWDGKSRGTAYVLHKCEESGKDYIILNE